MNPFGSLACCDVAASLSFVGCPLRKVALEGPGWRNRYHDNDGRGGDKVVFDRGKTLREPMLRSGISVAGNRLPLALCLRRLRLWSVSSEVRHLHRLLAHEWVLLFGLRIQHHHGWTWVASKLFSSGPSVSLASSWRSSPPRGHLGTTENPCLQPTHPHPHLPPPCGHGHGHGYHPFTHSPIHPPTPP